MDIIITIPEDKVSLVDSAFKSIFGINGTPSERIAFIHSFLERKITQVVRRYNAKLAEQSTIVF